MNLAGAMIWNLDNDDFNNKFCSSGRSPLIGIVKKLLNPITTTTISPNITTSTSTNTTNRTTTQINMTTIEPTITTLTSTTDLVTTTTVTNEIITSSTNIIIATTTTITVNNKIKEICVNGDGFYPNYDSNCASYFICLGINTQFERYYKMDCPPGLLFNQITKNCDWSYLIKCKKN